MPELGLHVHDRFTEPHDRESTEWLALGAVARLPYSMRKKTEVIATLFVIAFATLCITSLWIRVIRLNARVEALERVAESEHEFRAFIASLQVRMDKLAHRIDAVAGEQVTKQLSNPRAIRDLPNTGQPTPGSRF